MQSWYEIPNASELKPGEMTHASANGEDIIVLNVGGEFRAFVNRCGHANAPMDLGTFKSGVIKCPQHNAVFDAKTGEVRGQHQMTGAGMDMSKLPKEFLDHMMALRPVLERVACRPLTPLPITVGEGKVRVWV